MTKKRIAAGAIALFAILLNLYVCLTNYVDSCSVLLRVLLCLATDAVALVYILRLEDALRVPFDIFKDRAMFLSLVKNDFRAKFAGSYFGLFWAYIQPLITIVLYWFVFQVGLRSGSVSNHPFILFLMSGLIPWFYFSEVWNSSTNSLVEYNYLVKKMVFNVGVLPPLKAASSLFVHVFFVVVVSVVCMFYGYGPDLYLIQLLYYIPCIIVFVLGLAYITSACTVFFRDMTQIVNIVLTIGVWLTPIMWNPATAMSAGMQTLFKLNPMYYIVDGFRDALLNKTWFWQKPTWSIYFWCVALVAYLIGVKMFNRLKPHFSDVL